MQDHETETESGAEAGQEPEWGNENTLTVSENGVYVCRVRDKAGNVEEMACTVENIDCTPPRFTCSRPDKWYEGGTQITVDAEDLQPDGTQGCGLAEQAFSTDGITFGASPVLFIEKEGDYEIWVKDRMGNIKKETFTFLYDKREPVRSPEKNTADNGGKSSKKKGGEKQEVIPVQPVPEPDAGTAGELPSPPIAVPWELTEQNETIEPELRGYPGLLAPAALMTEEPEAEQDSREKEKKIPVRQKQNGREPGQEKMVQDKPVRTGFNWKKAALYSVWMAAALCGLLWLLFCLIFEHATVYKKDEKGKYQKIGRCAIVRKKEHKQINLLPLMKKGEERDYKVCFARVFVFLYRKDKMLIRTWYGVELRKVAKEIEIFSCNSENHMLT